MIENPVGQYVEKNTVFLHQDASVREGAFAMGENGVDCAIVLDGQGNLAGIVTARDLVYGMLRNARYQSSALWPDLRLQDVMTPQPVSIDENDSLERLELLMEEHGLWRVPVTRRVSSRKKKCIGMVELDDLVAKDAFSSGEIQRVFRTRSQRRASSIRQRALPGRNLEQRHEAHAVQTLHRFYRAVMDRTALPPERVPELTYLIMSLLLQRIQVMSAAHLIGQLPRKLQEQFWDLPAGPNRRITARILLEQLGAHLGIDRQSSEILLSQFFWALEDLLDPGAIENIKAQLPEDLRDYFGEKSVA